MIIRTALYLIQIIALGSIMIDLIPWWVGVVVVLASSSVTNKILLYVLLGLIVISLDVVQSLWWGVLIFGWLVLLAKFINPSLRQNGIIKISRYGL